MSVITARPQLEGAGFLVHRPFPSLALPDMDPFLLLDEMGPVDVGPREAKGAPDPPHRGFETVTYMLDGAMVHEDSGGNASTLRAGDLQWMTAGSGVIHSEMPEPTFFEEGGRMHGVQLWINLPAAQKMMAPRYQDLRGDQVPRVEVPGGVVRVISGTFGGIEARVDTVIPIQYLHATLEDGAIDVDIPEGHNGFAYVIAGDAVIGGERARDHQLVRLAPGTRAIEGSGEILVLSGPPLAEPVARYGPFVMNTHDEIIEAVRDFQSGRFGTIPRKAGPRTIALYAPPARAAAPAAKLRAAGHKLLFAEDRQTLEAALRGGASVLIVDGIGEPDATWARKLAASSGVLVAEGPDVVAAVQALD